MKTIGFVCEGPRDIDMLEAVIRNILNEDIHPLYLQPEASLTGGNGNGWKGVWSWCYKNGQTLDQYMQGAVPKIDLIVVQMDGDVSRKEREVHCECWHDECEFSGTVFPLKCQKEDCPVEIPCSKHHASTDGYVEHLRSLLHSCFPGEYIPIFIIPCDSTDAWIVAAFDDIENAETIVDPWTNVISKKKEYHGIRVPGHNKTKAVYDKFIPYVCKNWDLVKSRCPQAAVFEQMIKGLQ